MRLASSFPGGGHRVRPWAGPMTGSAREPGIQPSIPSRWIPDSQASPGLRNDEEVFIPIRRAGLVAAEFCKMSGGAEVAAVFERSFYLRSGDLFVCVGEPAIRNGPLTLLADMRVARLGLQPGELAIVGENCIAIGAVTFACQGCEPWRPPPWPQAAGPHASTEARASIVRRAATEAPAEGFGRALADADEARAGFVRVARRHLARLHAWLLSEAVQGPSEASTVRDIVGTGHGLTPSGDDVLSGALALLDALGEHAHARLAYAVDQLPSGLTSPLSHCFLRVAAAGHFGEGLHAAAASVVRGDADAAIAAIRNIGHSSGWDMLAGIVTALDAVTPRNDAASG